MQTRVDSDDPLAMIRQLAPALRRWLRDLVLGIESGKAIQSGLTFTAGMFKQQPSLHVDAFPCTEDKNNWNLGRDT